MKRYFPGVLFIVLLTMATQLSAQYIHLKGGYNLSTMKLEGNTDADISGRSGYNLGIMGGLSLGLISIEGGVFASTRGYKSELTTIFESNPPIEITDKEYFSVTYLDVPINAKISIGAAGIKGFATVGPVFSYGLDGSYEYKSISNGQIIESEERKLVWGNEINSDLKRFDVGISTGIGVDILKLQISANYTWGLTDIAPSAAGSYIKNRLFQVCIGFKIFG